MGQSNSPRLTYLVSSSLLLGSLRVLGSIRLDNLLCGRGKLRLDNLVLLLRSGLGILLHNGLLHLLHNVLLLNRRRSEVRLHFLFFFEQPMPGTE
mgnify:CR=1 FL=1